ncbi:MAG: sigma-E factor negative regulatory protein [Gammaproteobacteria bacterium]
MTEKLREQISALADDELPEGEHELLARRFASEKYLCVCWERYHLIGEAMRKTLPQVDVRGFADRIMLALNDTPAEKSRRRLSGYLGRTAAGIGVAVCVAVVALVSLRHDGTRVQPIAASSEIVPPSFQVQATPADYGMVSNAAWNGNAPDVQAELGNYIINHNEISSALGQQNLLPYFYITTYNTRKQLQHPAPAGRQPTQPNKR